MDDLQASAIQGFYLVILHSFMREIMEAHCYHRVTSPVRAKTKGRENKLKV